ncbi:RNA polymerase sigma factor [Pseudohongiella spirulinae]|uniref:RNA polymerase sigma-70 factor, ECF subfamily n=1 Tax=Pseudohongiella spirulinae TaxID=1249552 RepID=A0A0S2KCB2_9GAMM|nr:sigma-70 family RNA polymerase sigma factor [Pseudohongiella spirulinae]ALO45865.1 RNA polymerase sigma-70 factor, ECF subfamily [Pseudohongiella spirulinae]
MDQSDLDLIRKAQAGSLAAWDTLVRRYEGQVYNFSLRFVGNADDAQDLMQEVFLGLYRNLEEFRGQAQLSTWLFRVAHNKAIDLARRRSVRPVLNAQADYDELQELRSEQPAPDEQLEAIQGNERVLMLLSQLPPAQRMVIELKIYQELTFDEIADLSGISANTAKTRFYTALKKIRELMEART